MLVRKPGDSQSCMVTAQGRTDKNEITAIVLQNCTITGEPEYMAVKDKNKAYLGRPWKDFARVVVMQSHIDEAIQPEGWIEWAGSMFHKTCFFGEYGNRGPRADMAKGSNGQASRSLLPTKLPLSPLPSSLRVIGGSSPAEFLMFLAWCLRRSQMKILKQFFFGL
ncbi:putative pectinesterase/pectinesterase inhibitor 28 [Prunus yedoensis var. nudiflora]|uniref:Putative pectinesterase/pectinesterase inhibitor 28 n=1 Tax=Prunus yedoensis var. nudiflora TaxID=2094558 RepID=A0A314YVU6_PRUYE|nr:putative pectinesterase/pectinesterase inhibitor 28 [Prunus yedoensis var. nudiflora]